MSRPEPSPGAAPAYRERLAPPWWWWVVGLAVGLGLAATVHGGRGGTWAWLPYVVAVVLVVAILAWCSTAAVCVDADGVRGGPARLGRVLTAEEVAAVEELDAPHTRAALGPRADPLGRVYQRAWVPTSVKVVARTDDPPYLLLSTRHPDRLAAAVVALVRSRG